MKVLHVSSAEMPFLQEQVRALSELGVECDVITATSSSAEGHGYDGRLSPIFDLIYGHNPLYYAFRGSTFWGRVVSQAVRNDYDLVHVNSGMVAPIAVAQPTRPLVTTLWGSDLLGDRLGGFVSKMTKRAALHCDAVIVQSDEMARHLPCQSRVIPVGVDTEKFRPVARDTALESLGWDPDERHVLFPYSDSRTVKRPELARQIVETVNDAQDTPVRFQQLSNVPHDKMKLYYSAADVLLLTSRREGSPNTVKEAMACNCPVVSTPVGDVPDLLGPVSNSTVCRDESQLIEQLNRIIQSGERSDGRQHVGRLDIDRMAEDILSVYEDVV